MLGVPFNVVGYSWLLSVFAHLTGRKPGVFTHFLWDYHIYENHIEGAKQQLAREPRPLPKLIINPFITKFSDLESWVTAQAFSIEGYNPHPAIPFSMVV